MLAPLRRLPNLRAARTQNAKPLAARRASTFTRSVAPSTTPGSQASMDPVVIDRVRGCLWGIFIADALAMPVHWYYDPRALHSDFGEITDYQAPKERHPGSIMSLSSTGGHGRGDQSGRIIGDVINHGKHEFWGKSNVHYHQGMKAGENTLNAICARVVMRMMAKNKGYTTSAFLEEYVKFMTTPGSHNDTYAESFHRDFFKNWAAGVPPEKCSVGTEGHNTPSIGGFVMLPPVILGSLAAGLPVAQSTTVKHLSLTHESKTLAAFAEMYTELIYNVTMGKDLKQACQQAATAACSPPLDLEKVMNSGYDDVRVIHSLFGSACYIDSSFPSMLYLAYKYADSFEKAVLVNTNVGGENCHRGAALGALVGAATGESNIPRRFIDGLHDSANIKKEIDSFTEALFGEGVCHK